MGERARELTVLILGDISVFILSLWVTLLVRYLSLPSWESFSDHLGPFLILSTVWIFIFYIAGLYDKHTVFLKSLLFSRILNTQVANGLIATMIFLIVPFGIAPKTNLVIYFFLSVIFMTWWRMSLYNLIETKTKHRALLLADGPEAIELVDEINNNDRYNYYFVRIIDEKTAAATEDFQQKLLALIEKEGIKIIVANPNGQYITAVLPKIFDLAFLKFKFTFLDFYKVYEDTFDRVPLSALRYEWFIAHVSQSKSIVYDFTKRIIDIVGSIILGLILILMLPFIYLALRLEGKGELFISQERIGQFNKPVTVYKIRTMTENRSASATWTTEDAKEGNVVTKVGAVLRKLSIDELPQVWTILKGEMSLIGPRNDIKGLGERLAAEIPYYNIRNFVKPGVTGWAQTHQHYIGNNISPQSLDESKIRLAYDLYYVKNRSLLIDVDVALRTFKTLLSRFGVTIRLPR
ncbi:MAG TPA: sugar transferase [Candidatus Paceibacterota bacterium]|nr:sugar transferase [Candidatus Paceibacterota bacterium]